MAFLLAAVLPVTAFAGQKFCVFDPGGTNGPGYGYARDYAVAAKGWGVTLDLKAYTDERLAAEDFKAGQCDGVAISALRGRQFNSYVGSVDSIGGVPGYPHLRAVVDVLSSPKSADKMVSGQYEVVGILPVGAAYVFVRDRSINSVDKAAGKKVAVLDYDKSQARLVQQMGAQPVASEIINFGSKFNNGQVDIIAAPAVAYQPLELHKGLGSTGAIYRFPLIQLTANLIVRHDKFPDGFGQKSRFYIQSQFDRAVQVVNQAENAVPQKYWLDIPEPDKKKYELMMREARVQLTKEGFYDPRMMTLLKRVRCKVKASAAECSEAVENQ
ncbi:putative solute-binding protein [Perlucidibaca piscinae]|uniref:putative solute-binding protein n=1 Tax=Perlucidibaca piscinae TaxID=392589 RepID=UPI001D179C1D|nr:putative solute-binding protein [Perlucidibaca piscinae]